MVGVEQLLRSVDLMITSLATFMMQWTYSDLVLLSVDTIKACNAMIRMNHPP